MAYLAVDKNGDEAIFDSYPERDSSDLDEMYKQGYDYNTLLRENMLSVWSGAENAIELPKGSIKKLIGKELTWNDEPIEIEKEWKDKVKEIRNILKSK